MKIFLQRLALVLSIVANIVGLILMWWYPWIGYVYDTIAASFVLLWLIVGIVRVSIGAYRFVNRFIYWLFIEPFRFASGNQRKGGEHE